LLRTSSAEAVHPADTKASLLDLLEDLGRHIAIRWDPSVFSAYECTQCLRVYNSSMYDSSTSTTDSESDDHDNGKIPIICWRNGHDSSPTHDFKPFVPKDILEYWPEQFPNLKRLFIIVEDDNRSALGMRCGGGQVFNGALERFFVVDESTLEREWDVPVAFVREMEKNFAEAAEGLGTTKPHPLCSVLVMVG
jgi:hypothetical protein